MRQKRHEQHEQKQQQQQQQQQQYTTNNIKKPRSIVNNIKNNNESINKSIGTKTTVTASSYMSNFELLRQQEHHHHKDDEAASLSALPPWDAMVSPILKDNRRYNDNTTNARDYKSNHNDNNTTIDDDDDDDIDIEQSSLYSIDTLPIQQQQQQINEATNQKQTIERATTAKRTNVSTTQYKDDDIKLVASSSWNDHDHDTYDHDPPIPSKSSIFSTTSNSIVSQWRKERLQREKEDQFSHVTKSKSYKDHHNNDNDDNNDDDVTIVDQTTLLTNMTTIGHNRNMLLETTISPMTKGTMFPDDSPLPLHNKNRLHQLQHHDNHIHYKSKDNTDTILHQITNVISQIHSKYLNNNTINQIAPHAIPPQDQTLPNLLSWFNKYLQQIQNNTFTNQQNEKHTQLKKELQSLTQSKTSILQNINEKQTQLQTLSLQISKLSSQHSSHQQALFKLQNDIQHSKTKLSSKQEEYLQQLELNLHSTLQQEYDQKKISLENELNKEMGIIEYEVTQKISSVQKKEDELSARHENMDLEYVHKEEQLQQKINDVDKVKKDWIIKSEKEKKDFEEFKLHHEEQLDIASATIQKEKQELQQSLRLFQREKQTFHENKIHLLNDIQKMQEKLQSDEQHIEREKQDFTRHCQYTKRNIQSEKDQIIQEKIDWDIVKNKQRDELLNWKENLNKDILTNQVDINKEQMKILEQKDEMKKLNTKHNEYVSQLQTKQKSIEIILKESSEKVLLKQNMSRELTTKIQELHTQRRKLRETLADKVNLAKDEMETLTAEKDKLINDVGTQRDVLKLIAKEKQTMEIEFEQEKKEKLLLLQTQMDGLQKEISSLHAQMETSKEEYTKQLKQQMQDLEMQRKTTLEINKLEINAQRDQMEQELSTLNTKIQSSKEEFFNYKTTKQKQLVEEIEQYKTNQKFKIHHDLKLHKEHLKSMIDNEIQTYKTKHNKKIQLQIKSSIAQAMMHMQQQHIMLDKKCQDMDELQWKVSNYVDMVRSNFIQNKKSLDDKWNLFQINSLNAKEKKKSIDEEKNILLKDQGLLERERVHCKEMKQKSQKIVLSSILQQKKRNVLRHVFYHWYRIALHNKLQDQVTASNQEKENSLLDKQAQLYQQGQKLEQKEKRFQLDMNQRESYLLEQRREISNMETILQEREKELSAKEKNISAEEETIEANRTETGKVLVIKELELNRKEEKIKIDCHNILQAQAEIKQEKLIIQASEKDVQDKLNGMEERYQKIELMGQQVHTKEGEVKLSLQAQQEDIHDKQIRVEEQEAEIQQQKEEIQILQNEVRTQRQELYGRVKDLEQVQHGFQLEKINFQNEKHELEQQKKILKQQSDELNGKFQQLEEQTCEWNKEYSEKQKYLKELKCSLEIQDKSNKMQQEKIESSSLQLKHDNHQYSQMISKFTSDQEEFNKQKQKQRDKLDKKENDLIIQQQQVDVATKQLHLDQRELEETKNKILSDKNEIIQNQKRIKELAIQLKRKDQALIREKAMLKEKWREYEENIKKFQQDFTD